MWMESDGKTCRPVPEGWRKEWLFENVYAWVSYNPPPMRSMNLCVTMSEPNAEQRAAIEARYADATPPAADYVDQLDLQLLARLAGGQRLG